MNLIKRTLAACRKATSPAAGTASPDVRPATHDNSNDKARVTLENLLRFKRNEQPPVEFWQQFDRDLRAKQLAAIVAKRPWWTPLARHAGLVSRFSIPLGAAAALVIALAGFHAYRAYAPAQSGGSGAENVATTLPESGEVAAARAEAPAHVVSEETSALAIVPEGRVVAAVAAYHDPAKREVTAPAPMDARSLALDAGSEASESPSARWIAANLAAAQAAEPEVIRNLLGLSRSLDARIVPAVRSRAEPLEQMAPPSSERRTRLLGGVVPALATYDTDVPVPVSDRFVQGLSDERLYQTVSRYAEGGQYLSIKVKF
jgi:hypothetical protein